MNKQECRNKNKRHFHHHKAPDIESLYTSTTGANENVSESLSKAPDITDDVINEANNDFDNLGYGIKAPESKNSYNNVLISAIIISAVLATLIYISGAK